ncbi:hypothetical protein AB0J83_00470 [Actinoplanes sp. NPDC049596]|uniref:hypothetical protein n=1 Tax=unclassified Actinoplanes TaxID=2626549 RepID=UPI0034213BE2
MAARSPVLLSMLAAVAVAGCSTAEGAGAPVAAASSQAGVAPSATGATAARTIPATAFYTMPEGMRREQRKAEGSDAVPELCDRELAPGDGVVASAAMMNLYQTPDSPEGSVPHGMLYQTIRSYDGDGATAFMERARDGLAGCQSFKTGESTVRVRTKALPGAADEALTIDLVRPQLDLPGDPTGGEQTNKVVVMRFGTVVTVLYDDEYERSSSIPQLVDTFVDGSAKAIKAWRG